MDIKTSPKEITSTIIFKHKTSWAILSRKFNFNYLLTVVGQTGVQPTVFTIRIHTKYI